MSNLSIQSINPDKIPIDVYSLHRILSSDALTDVQKINFLKRRSTEVKGILEIELGTDDFNKIMSNRPLMIFKPIKNVFTKKGDRYLLAKTLEIPPNEMDDFVKKATKNLPHRSEISLIPKDKLEAIKTYVFRHGSQEQVIKFLDYELSNSKDIRKTLRQTLEYTTGGIADYFARPIHRMNNETFLCILGVISQNIEEEINLKNLSEEDALIISKVCLARIYQIQENSKFKNSAKLKKEIETKSLKK